jgi:predicted Zn-dependent protease
VALDSAFAMAWSQLSRSYSNLYYNVVRKEPGSARRAKEALDRAEALSPGSPVVRRARYTYLANVLNDQAGALQEIDGMLRVSPNDPTLLALSAGGDLGRGELGTALAKLERARDLDPRSAIVLTNLTQVYAMLDRGADGSRPARRWSAFARST